MREINNASDFFGWAENTIRSSQVQVPFPVGILRNYHEIFRQMEERGRFSVGQTVESWALHLGALVDSARQDEGETQWASAMVGYFVGELYAAAIDAGGSATLRNLVRGVQAALSLQTTDLRIAEGGTILRSSPTFDERFFCRVRVSIPENFTIARRKQKAAAAAAQRRRDRQGR